MMVLSSLRKALLVGTLLSSGLVSSIRVGDDVTTASALKVPEATVPAVTASESQKEQPQQPQPPATAPVAEASTAAVEAPTNVVAEPTAQEKKAEPTAQDKTAEPIAQEKKATSASATATGPSSQPEGPVASFTKYKEAFLVSFSMVGVAEVFDKTWFVVLVMALRHDWMVVFWGCFLALALHVPIAAIFGYSLTKVLSPFQLELLAATTYGFMFILYTWDYMASDDDDDIFEAGKAEAAEEVEEGEEEEQQTSTGKAAQHPRTRSWAIFLRAFLACFIAEWGDRTQIAMIGLHASQPLYPVMWGSLFAFLLLTISAVIVAVFLSDQQISERKVKFVVALSFAVFTCWSLHDAYIIHSENKAKMANYALRGIMISNAAHWLQNNIQGVFVGGHLA